MIKMIAGKTGVLVNGIVVPKTKESDPFRSTPEHEARMVELGLAKYVDEPSPVDDSEEALPDGVTAIPAYSEESSAKELREIGELCGLVFKKNMSKSDMIAALDAHIEAHTIDGVEVNEDGEITVDDGEGAPTFDPSEAVQ